MNDGIAMIFNTTIPDKYKGISYEQASREATRLIITDGWYKNFISLFHLFQIMKQHELDARELVYNQEKVA